MDHFFPHNRMDMASRTKSQRLTKKERSLCKVLQRVSGNSLWAITIQNTLEGRDPFDNSISRDFRELINSLWEALQDDRGTMIKCIDQEATEAIEKFFS